MAQIVTITNPLTGQPAQVDQLEHTAQEIDDAIARALPGGAIDIALQNKAPDGFGYGDTQSIIFWDDEDGTKLEQFLETKFAPASMRSKVYRTNLVDRPICKISGNGGFADIIANNDNDHNGYPENTMIVYYAFNKNITGPSIAVKQKINGTWYPWEYVNPPMELGVEYRTTERYLGKPVYVKIVDFGVLPANSKKVVAHGIDNLGCVLDYSGGAGYWVLSSAPWISNIEFTNTNIEITTNADEGAYATKVILKYFKSTD